MTKQQTAAAVKTFKRQLARSTPTAVLVVIIALLISLTLSNGDDTPIRQTDNRTGPFEVVHVVDGDTIVVDKNGQLETVRLIGIDTPEVDSPFTETECFGPEASAFTRNMLLNEFVSLEADTTQDDRDIYDRLLRYVHLGNTNVNQLLIQEGYAFEFTFRTAYSYQQEFKQAQDTARLAAAGLWSDDTCAGLTVAPDVELGVSQPIDTTVVADGCIHFSNAPENIGVDTCVTGVVNHVFVSGSDTTFINFCKNYRTCPFSSVIFRDDKDSFSDISDYAGQTITISGRIDTYQARPQITLRQQSQITIE